MKLTEFARRLGENARKRIEQGEQELYAKLHLLEQRVAELEARPSMTYCGVWESKAYARGDFVTHGGSVWHCRYLAGSSDRPGSSACWQLAVKRGADAKDRG